MVSKWLLMARLFMWVVQLSFSMKLLFYPEEIQVIQQQAKTESYSLIYISVDCQLVGVLEMLPTIRPEAYDIVQALQQRGIETYIISGDAEAPTRRLTQTLGIDHYFAETLPENKADLVQQLKDEGRFVAFIGDGINDSIAFKNRHKSLFQ